MRRHCLTPVYKGFLRRRECFKVITVVDYGMGHPDSVRRALERLNFKVGISDDPYTILQSDGVVLAGVGAFGAAMHAISSRRLDETLWEVSLRGIPLLGIGLGMQLLFTESEEYGLHRGLNLLSGVVRRLPAGAKKPHVGWNELTLVQPHPLVARLKHGHGYFMHACYVEVTNVDDLLATTDNGGNIAAIAGRNRVFGVQFRPEKSGQLGSDLLRQFAALCVKEKV